jgi:ABC-type uncharacterized transport system auxiliary subunit
LISDLRVFSLICYNRSGQTAQIAVNLACLICAYGYGQVIAKLAINFLAKARGEKISTIVELQLSKIRDM